MITVGSLFAGIGGIELGLERTGGFETLWQVENNPYAIRVLEKHWPDVRRWDDVRSFPPCYCKECEPLWTVDLICGGFPCQPFSSAGKREGKADARNLWPSTFRVLRIIRPKWVLLENVAALRNPTREKEIPIEPSYLGEILGDLASIGYCVRWDCIPAAALGAPHRRDRIFIVAYSHRDGRCGICGDQGYRPDKREEWGDVDGADTKISDAVRRGGKPRTERSGREEGPNISGGREGSNLADSERDGRKQSAETICEGESIPTGGGKELPDSTRKRSQKCKAKISEGSGSDDGPESPSNNWWAVEPDVGRVAHGVPSRVDRLRCLGEAVVSQVAEFIGREILKGDCDEK